MVLECTNFALVGGHCATMEENENDVVAIALIVVVILVAPTVVAVVPLAISHPKAFLF